MSLVIVDQNNIFQLVALGVHVDEAGGVLQGVD